MATLQQVIQLVFEGVDNASETAKTVSGSLTTLGGVATDIAQPFANLAEVIEKADATLLGLATLIGGLAVRESAKFTQSLADLDRFLQQGEGSASDYTDAFKNLSLRYGISVNDIIASTADWSAANYKISQSIDLTKLSLDYATAGQISAAEATDLLKKILSGLNTDLVSSASTATKWGDIINFVADDSKSNFKELATAVALLAPSFSSSGMSAEQFISVIGSSVNLLQSGSGAADGLRTIFGFLTKTTDEGAAKFAEFNVVVGEGNIVQSSVQETLSKIAAIWPDLTEKQKLNAAIILTSKERADQFKNVMDAWPETANRATKAVSNATNSMAAEVDRALTTSIAAFNRFAQAINQVFIALGLELEPTTVAVSDALTVLAQAFDKLITSGALDPLLGLLRAQGADLADLFKTIAANLPAAFKGVDLSGIVNAFGDLGDAVQDFFDALLDGADLTTVEGLRKALQLVVDSGKVLIEVTAGLVKAFIPFAESIRGTVQEFNKLDGASRVDFGKFLGAMQAIIVVGPKIAIAILSIAEAGIDMGDAITRSFGGVQVVINAAQVAFDSVVWSILKVYEGVLEATLGFANLGKTLENSKFSFLLTDEAIRSNNETIKNLNGKLSELRPIINGVTENLERNKTEFKEGWGKAVEGAGFNAEKLKNQIKSTKDEIKAFSEQTGASGKNIVYFADDLDEAAYSVENLLDNFDRDIKLEPPDITLWDDFGSSIAYGASELNIFSDAAEAAGFGTKQFASSTKEAGTSIETAKLKTIEWSKELKTLQLSSADELAKNIKITGDAFLEAGNKTGSYNTALEGISVKYEQVGTGTVKATGAFAATGKSAEDSAKKVDEATKKANDYLIKMEEIASNERIKTIEAVVDFKIANVEADAKRVVAAFESIDATVKSTGELIGSLFESLIATDDIFKASFIRDQIEIENKRRQEFLDIQKKLADAEISRIEAQTRALERGDAILKIDGTNLEPHLNAFMWEILKAIRVRVNAEFADYLLGVA